MNCKIFKWRYVYEYVYVFNPVTKVININYLNFGRYAMHIQHQTLFWIAIHVTIYWLDTPLTIPPICNDITCTKCSYQVIVIWFSYCLKTLYKAYAIYVWHRFCCNDLPLPEPMHGFDLCIREWSLLAAASGWVFVEPRLFSR